MSKIVQNSSFRFQVFIVLLFTEKLINIVYRNAEINKNTYITLKRARKIARIGKQSNILLYLRGTSMTLRYHSPS